MWFHTDQTAQLIEQPVDAKKRDLFPSFQAWIHREPTWGVKLEGSILRRKESDTQQHKKISASTVLGAKPLLAAPV